MILALVYGYVPYLILPLYASLDRIDQRLIEAARDLGASPAGAFWRVVVPLSKTGTLAGIVLIALPMFGDYYTPDLISGSPRTAMFGNAINGYVQGGPDKSLGAALTLLLSAFLLVFMLYYLRVLRADQRGGGCARDDAPRHLVTTRHVHRRRSASWRDRLANPWGRPRFLRLTTWLYILWSLVPVLLAIRFAFNSGRSRTSLQGWSLRWFWKDPNLSVFHDPTLQAALKHSLVLADARDADRRRRWARRSRWACAAGAGRGAGVANIVLLLPLVTPELVFAVGMFLLFTTAFDFIGLGTHGAGDRAGDVHALLGGADRARAAGDHRARRRGGRGRPRRAADARGLARAAAAAACRRWRRACWSPSRCRSTTSSSASTWPRARTPPRCRCASTRRRAARRPRRSTRWPRSCWWSRCWRSSLAYFVFRFLTRGEEQESAFEQLAGRGGTGE